MIRKKKSRVVRTKTSAPKTKVMKRRKKTKSPAPVGKETRKKVSAEIEAYRADFEAWKSGSPLSGVAKKHGVKRRVVKLAFIALAGGKEALNELRASGAGGRAFGGKRGGGRTKEQRVIDDSNTPRVKTNPKWTVEREWIVRPVTVEMYKGEKGRMNGREIKLQVFVSPKGNRYVRASASEKADLIVACGDGLPDIRFKKLAKSSALKKVRQEDALVKRGQKAMAAKKKAKVRKHKTISKLVSKK